MPIRVTCPVCASRCTAPDTAAGKRTKCPKCNEPILVPNGQVPVAETKPTPSPQRDINPFDFAEVSPQPHRSVSVADPKQSPTLIHVSPQPIVNVQVPSRAAHSLGIGSLVLGCVSLPLAFIPVLNLVALPLAGVGLLLGLGAFGLSLARKGSGIGFAIAGSTVNIVSLALACFMLYGLSKVIQNTPMIQEASDRAKTPWIESGEPFIAPGLKVEIVSAQQETLKVRPGSSVALKEPKKAYFVVRVRVTNTSTDKKIDYRSWGTSYSIDARLKDDKENVYSSSDFSLADIEGLVGSDSLYPGKSLTDLIAFEVPVSSAKTLFLDFNKRNVSAPGPIRMKISLPFKPK